MSRRASFLAGERPDDVHLFLREDLLSNPDALGEFAQVLDTGVAMVVAGSDASGALQSAIGIDPMTLAKDAMDTEGTIADSCTDGTCPSCGADTPRLIFSFAEAQNEAVGGMYAEGPVIHAYAACDCGETYSDKWVVSDDRPEDR